MGNRIKTSLAALAIASISLPASAAIIVPTGSPGTTGATALYLNLAGEVSAEAGSGADAAELASFVGAPNDAFTGLGEYFVQYDLGIYRMINGTGQDFNVYEVDFGSPETNLVDILVSADGLTFFNVESTSSAALDLAGDELHGSASFRRSYDLAGAVTSLGASEFRYLRINGTGGGLIGTTNEFDLDGVGFANFALAATSGVPEPGTWAMMLLGFGLMGASMRRKQGGARVRFAI